MGGMTRRYVDPVANRRIENERQGVTSEVLAGLANIDRDDDSLYDYLASHGIRNMCWSEV